jgi:DMSO/TMAO reductase YedYZ heme-binding membrane subunit
MLFAAVAWGLLATTTLVAKRVAKASAVLLHQVLGTVGLALLMVHLIGLLLDEFVEYGPLDLLVPFRAAEAPAAVAIGIIAMYVMLVVILTSWVRKRLGTTWWRRFHLLATPAFALALVHGMGAGTDSTRPWMWWMYVGTGLAVVFLLIVRAFVSSPATERRTQPAPSPTRGSVRATSR